MNFGIAQLSFREVWFINNINMALLGPKELKIIHFYAWLISRACFFDAEWLDHAKRFKRGPRKFNWRKCLNGLHLIAYAGWALHGVAWRNARIFHSVFHQPLLLNVA